MHNPFTTCPKDTKSKKPCSCQNQRAVKKEPKKKASGQAYYRKQHSSHISLCYIISLT